jgi:peptidyl-prolyl cis-trans isomerase C
MRTVLAGMLLVVGAGCATTSTSYLARVNDETITGKDLRQEFARSHSGLEKILGDDKEVRKYVTRLADRRLFVQEGYRMGLQDAADVRDEVGRFRTQKMIEAYLRVELDEKSKPTEDEVKAVFASVTHQSEARQIVVATQAEADAIAAQVKAGADFEALAREKSIAPSAKHGGIFLVGWGGDEAYERAVLPLRDGEVGPVFQSKMGWEVIRLEKRTPIEKPLPAEKVAPRIRQVLGERKRARREAELYAQLWAKYDARVLECAKTIAELKAAVQANDTTPCATWQGGSVTTAALAARVKLDQLGTTGVDWNELRSALVEDLVNREVVRRDAEAQGYAQRPEIVEEVRLRQDELVEGKLYKDHVTRGVEATEADARAYYEGHKEIFLEEAQYELAHVLLDTAEAAQKALERVRSGQPFKEVAAAFSQDPETAEQGGGLGFFDRRRLTGPLEPLLALEEGGVSDVVKTKAGYHVVKVLSIKPPRQRPFEDVKEDARARALQERKDKARDRWVATLRAAARVEINEAGIRAYEKERTEWIRKQDEADRVKKEADRARNAATAPPAPAPASGSTPAPAGETAPAAAAPSQDPAAAHAGPVTAPPPSPAAPAAPAAAPTPHGHPATHGR